MREEVQNIFWKCDIHVAASNREATSATSKQFRLNPTVVEDRCDSFISLDSGFVPFVRLQAYFIGAFLEIILHLLLNNINAIHFFFGWLAFIDFRLICFIGGSILRFLLLFFVSSPSCRFLLDFLLSLNAVDVLSFELLLCKGVFFFLDYLGLSFSFPMILTPFSCFIF